MDLAPIDFGSGGTGLADYFTTMNPAEPVMSPVSPIFTPASVTSTMSLDQAQQLATDWMAEPTIMGESSPAITKALAPTWWQTLTAPFVSVGQGLVTGTGQVATGVAQGLPNVLLASLASKMGLKATTGDAAPGQPKPIYITPAAAGVPPAGTGGTSSILGMPSTVGGFDTRTILLIGGLGLAAILLLKKR